MSGQNTKTSFTLQLELNKYQEKYLWDMNATGLYGFSIEETATRLLDYSFIHFLSRRSATSKRPYIVNPPANPPEL